MQIDQIQLNNQQITDYNNDLLIDLWNVKSNSIWSSNNNNLSKISSNSSNNSITTNSLNSLNTLNSLNSLNSFTYELNTANSLGSSNTSNSNSHTNLNAYDASSNYTTTADFNLKIEDDKKPINTQLYKTELCGSFMKFNYCPYGNKCQFAHGTNELKSIERPSNYRSKPCVNWMKYGKCRYGSRCCFKHQ